MGNIVKYKAKIRGWKATGVLAATVVLSVWLTPWFLVIGLPATGYYTYKWFRYRAKHGLYL